MSLLKSSIDRLGSFGNEVVESGRSNGDGGI